MKYGDFKNYFKAEVSALYNDTEAETLFQIFSQKILQKNSVELRNFSDKELEINEMSQFYNAVLQLKIGRPYQQILGEAEFFGMKFFVDENVLIPRPETEELLELAIGKLEVGSRKPGVAKSSLTTDDRQPITILDIGTGSGIIPIVLKKYFPEAEISAMDFSEKALEIAKKNADFHQTEIHFFHADYLKFQPEKKFDVIISNPPYISLEEMAEIPDSVKDFEPKMALFSLEKDALVFYRKIAADAQKCLAENGMVFLEINQRFGAETLALFKNFPHSELLKDLSGNDRMVFVGR